MDILTVYERIQVYRNDSYFFKNTSVNILSLFLFILSILLNIPVNISREYQETIVQLNKNETLKVYFYSIRKFEYDEIFKSIILISNFVRDFVTLTLTIVTNFILVVTVIIYYKKNNNLGLSLKKSSHWKKTLDYCKLAFLLCLISSITNVTSYISFLDVIIDNSYN